MPDDRPDTKGFGEDVTRTPEEVARDEGKPMSPVSEDPEAKERRERATDEFNLNEADHRRNPHG